MKHREEFLEMKAKKNQNPLGSLFLTFCSSLLVLAQNLYVSLSQCQFSETEVITNIKNLLNNFNIVFKIPGIEAKANKQSAQASPTDLICFSSSDKTCS